MGGGGWAAVWGSAVEGVAVESRGDMSRGPGTFSLVAVGLPRRKIIPSARRAHGVTALVRPQRGRRSIGSYAKVLGLEEFF